jgi:hypothetical protein
LCKYFDYCIILLILAGGEDSALISNIPEGKKKIKVAIIDSGVDTSKSDMIKHVIKSTGFRVSEEGIIIEDDRMPVKNEHGTAIAMIIRQICENVEFISVNILNERLATDGRVLLYAMEHTLSYNPDIIHLSLGTTKWRYILPQKRVVKEAGKNNILVVSAAGNDGQATYPAYLKGVVGVKSIRSNGYDTPLGYDGRFFFAPGGMDGIYGTEKLVNKNSCGNSMAAAYITGHVANILWDEGIHEYKEVVNRLRCKAYKK